MDAHYQDLGTMVFLHGHNYDKSDLFMRNALCEMGMAADYTTHYVALDIDQSQVYSRGPW